MLLSNGAQAARSANLFVFMGTQTSLPALLYDNLFDMSQNFQAGDFLIFQVESGYGLLRILAIEAADGEKVWHLAAYNEMFLDVETADAALEYPNALTISLPHVALTNRAFEATQTARMTNVPLTNAELKPFIEWKESKKAEVSDRSIRLMLGIR